MALTPEIWSYYPLYIRNEYIHEIEEANDAMIRNNPLNKGYVDHTQHMMPDYHYGRAEGKPLFQTRNQHFQTAPNREHASVGTDHQRLLKDRERRFLRSKDANKFISKVEEYEDPHRQHTPPPYPKYDENIHSDHHRHHHAHDRDEFSPDRRDNRSPVV